MNTDKPLILLHLCSSVEKICPDLFCTDLNDALSTRKGKKDKPRSVKILDHHDIAATAIHAAI
jgi:hypothetical protein